MFRHFTQVMICLSHPATVALASTKCPASRQVWQDLLRSQKFPAFLSGRAACHSRNHVLEKQIFCSYHLGIEDQPRSIMTKLYISVMLGILNVMAFCPAIHWDWILVRKTVLSPSKSTYGIHSKIKFAPEPLVIFWLPRWGTSPPRPLDWFSTSICKQI